MKCIENNKVELSDILLPDIFVSEYLPEMDEISLKIYLYLKLMVKEDKDIEPKNIQKILSIKEDEYLKAIETLEQDELILKTDNGYIILDIKYSEINKSYIPKLTPKADKSKTIVEQKRIAAASAINDSFFQGIMSLGWYSDIFTLFEKYMFDEDVMIALFHYCKERKLLKKNYVFKLAEDWYLNGVKTFENLEEHLSKQDKLNELKSMIKKALRLNRNLTEYEEEYVRIWYKKYNYDFKIIEIALKKTTSRTTNPTISYVNGILKNWNEKGYKTVEQILEQDNIIAKGKTNKIPVRVNTATKALKHKNYEQRKYEDLETYYDNV